MFKKEPTFVVSIVLLIKKVFKHNYTDDVVSIFFFYSASQNIVGSPVMAFSIPQGQILKKLSPPLQLHFETIEVSVFVFVQIT